LALYAARAVAGGLSGGGARGDHALHLGIAPGYSQARFQCIRDGRAFLSPLPLAAADPSPALAAIVADWGIHTLGEFAALPKADILHRLGAEGLALWERCAGETTRPLNLATPAQEFSAAFESEHPMETLEPLLFLLRRLVDRLALDLQNAALAARELQLLLTLEDESMHTHAIRLPQPTHQPDILFRALVTYLEHVRTVAAVVALALAIEPTRIPQRQEGLFDSALRDPHGFSESLARTAALTGPDRVGTPEVADTHRPDSFHLATPPEVLGDLGALRADHALQPGMALRRYRPPIPATVELLGRTPAFVWAGTVRGRVGALLGPWYGSGDWWQTDRRWEREDWDVELENGGLYRLFRTPGGWFLDGEYD
jgi:protein ImuB